MSKDGRDVRHTTDRDGNTWLTDEDGRIVTDGSGNRIPGPAEIENPGSSFPTYDTSRGHCGLCGRPTCNGGCFK